MSKRTAITLDDEVLKELRLKQAKLVKISTESISFSRVLNDSLRDYFKLK